MFSSALSLEPTDLLKRDWSRHHAVPGVISASARQKGVGCSPPFVPGAESRYRHRRRCQSLFSAQGKSSLLSPFRSEHRTLKTEHFFSPFAFVLSLFSFFLSAPGDCLPDFDRPIVAGFFVVAVRIDEDNSLTKPNGRRSQIPAERWTDTSERDRAVRDER